jgi:hypothetical protein
MALRPAAAFFALCLLLAPLAAQAICSCTTPPLPRRWADADAIFTGKVKSVEVLKKFVQLGGNDMPVRVTLEVGDVFKGPPEKGKTFDIHTSLTKDTCTGYPFAKGGEYLVFGYLRREETFERWSFYDMPVGTYGNGGLCGGTKPLDAAATPELDALARLAGEAPPAGH